MVAIELIIAHLHVYAGFVALGYALLARTQGRMLSSWILAYFTIAVEIFWCGSVTRAVPMLQFFRTWNAQFKLFCALALAVALWELLSARGPISRTLISGALGLGVCVWLIPELMTGWVTEMAPYVDPAMLPDDGQPRDIVWTSVVAYRYGWYIYGITVLALLSVLFVIILRWPGLFLSFLLIALFGFLLVVIKSRNIWDILAGVLREKLGLNFTVAGDFRVEDLIDPSKWISENFTVPIPEYQLPSWWPIGAEVLTY